MLPNRELLSGLRVKGSLRSCRGTQQGTAAFLGVPSSQVATVEQRFQPQGFRLNGRDSPLGASASGLQTASVLWRSCLQPLLVKAYMQESSLGIKLLLCCCIRAASGPCLLCFPSALLEPRSSHQGGSSDGRRLRQSSGKVLQRKCAVM